MTARGRLAGVLWSSTLTGAWLLTAAALGGLFAYTTFQSHPLAVPGVLLGAVLLAISISRPEVGIVAALLLVSLGTVGLELWRPWLLGVIASGLLFLVTLARLASGQDRLPLTRLSVVVITYVAAIALMLASSQLAGLTLPAVRTVATGFLLFGSIVATISSRSQVQWVMSGAVAGATLIALNATLQYISGAESEVGFFSSSGDYVYRVSGGLGWPNELGGFLALLAPFALAGAILSQRGRILYLAAFGLMTIGIYASFSRGALIALAVIPFFFLRLRHILFAVPLIAAFVTFLAPGLLFERFITLTSGGTELATRLDIWRTAASIWREHPLLGVGLGQFPTAYAEARIPGKLFLPGTIFQPPPHAHNLFLHHLAEGGIIGFVAILALLAVAIHLAIRLCRHRDRWISIFGRAMLASLAAFVTHNLFDVTLTENTGIYLFALLGLLGAVYTIAGRDSSPERDLELLKSPLPVVIPGPRPSQSP
jgi:O-antigen ligase